MSKELLAVGILIEQKRMRFRKIDMATRANKDGELSAESLAETEKEMFEEITAIEEAIDTLLQPVEKQTSFDGIQ